MTNHGLAFEILDHDDPARAKGYLYRVTAEFRIALHLATGSDFHDEFLELDRISEFLSLLVVKPGYCWDGPSGPTLDTVDFLRGSLVHDCLYQTIREGGLPASSRAAADRILRELSAEDGMSFARRWLDWAGLRLFGGPAARQASAHQSR